MIHHAKRNRGGWSSIAMLLGLILCSAAALPAAEDAKAASRAGTGYFRVAQIDGRWWFLSPDGKPFLSAGVCHATVQGDSIGSTGRSPYRQAAEKKHGSAAKWREVTARRLLAWGFNTLGAWSDEELSRAAGPDHPLAYAPTVDLGSGFVAQTARGKMAWLHGDFPDVFDPAFEDSCRRTAGKRCGPRKEDRALLGWFTDNELRWGPDWRTKEELLTSFLNLPAGAKGRAAAVEMLRERYGQVAKLNAVWKTNFGSWDDLAKAGKIAAPYVRKEIYSRREEDEARANREDPRRGSFAADCDAFAGLVAERYFRATREAIRSADPNHLVFGCRFAYPPPAPVLAAASKHLDVISFNCYSVDPREVISKYAGSARPVIIGEFTFRAKDSGLPNSRGAGPTVETQAERAAGFEKYVAGALSRPEVVGYHWFQYSDQPKEGRFDGENSNYGLVNVEDKPYPLLTQTMTRVNGAAGELHQAPALSAESPSPAAANQRIKLLWIAIGKDDFLPLLFR